MQIDALTVAALRDDLEATLLGARIEDIVQPTPAAIALLCWGGGLNRWLLASAHPRFARVQLLDVKPRKMASEPPAFVMLLRKYLEGARIVRIAQPRWERILDFGFARGPEVASGQPSLWLTVEMMGKLSNVIAREADGTILGALHLVGSDVNRYRTIAPHVEYRPPPPQHRIVGGNPQPKLDGANVTATELHTAAEEMLAEVAARASAPADAPQKLRNRKRSNRDAPTLAGLVSAQIEGFSRELGREVAAQATGTPDTALTDNLPWEAVAAAIMELARLPESHTWTPTLVYDPERDAADQAEGIRPTPVAYAAYQPAQYAALRLERVIGVNTMLATYYAGAEWHASVDEAKSGLRHILHTHQERCQRKAQALAEELAALDEAQRLRTEADLLLAFQSDIPDHASNITLEDPFATSGTTDGATDGAKGGTAPTITLTLDPRLTAVENANRRYARYHKLQRATALIPPQIAANDLELARIAQLETDLSLAETPAEIVHVRAEVAEAGYLRTTGSAAEQAAYEKATRGKGNKAKAGKTNKAGKGGKPGKGGKGTPQQRKPEGGTPLRRQSVDGIPLLVGKNSRQNEEVTFHQASANDLWLHARGVPGAHVIIKSGGRPVPETTLNEAAGLAAYYSQARTAGSVPVDYTEQRYVRHMKGGGPGMVIYEREHTVHAAPADPAQEESATRRS